MHSNLDRTEDTPEIVLDPNYEMSDQLVRLLQLAILSGKGFSINYFPGGLKRVHLKILEFASVVTNGFNHHYNVGDESVCFLPCGIRVGKYGFSVGSLYRASSLVKAICISLAVADAPSEITIFGQSEFGLGCGYLERGIQKLLTNAGLAIDIKVESRGFPPFGVGKVILRTEGGGLLRRFYLDSRGDIIKKRVVGIIKSSEDSRYEQNLRRELSSLFGRENVSVKVCDESQSKNITETLILEIEELHLNHFFSNSTDKVLMADLPQRLAKLESEVDEFYESGAVIQHYYTDVLLPLMAASEGGKCRVTDLEAFDFWYIKMIEQFMCVEISCSKVGERLHELKFS